MIKLAYVPDGRREIIKYYGNPDKNHDGIPDPEWWEDNMIRRNFPFTLYQSWGDEGPVKRQWVHKKVAESLIDVLEEIMQTVPPKYLRRFDADRFGGLYCFRAKRGGKDWSTHSWGIAIDVNPHLGPLGGPNQQPEFIVQAFTRRGWVWLGDADGMHFQACSEY